MTYKNYLAYIVKVMEQNINELKDLEKLVSTDNQLNDYNSGYFNSSMESVKTLMDNLIYELRYDIKLENNGININKN